MRHIILVTCILLASFQASAKAPREDVSLTQAIGETPQEDACLTLPSAPKGAPLVIYQIPKTFFEPTFRSKLSSYVTDCRSYMESLGMEFPTGGFALFYSKPSILILCTNLKNHSLMIHIELSERRKAEQDAAANP